MINITYQCKNKTANRYYSFKSLIPHINVKTRPPIDNYA